MGQKADANPMELPDEELLARARKGDEDAFVMLYRRRQPAIYRFAYQMSGSRSVADEVVQEVFLSLIGAKNGYNSSRGTLQSYLYGVARNHMLKLLEKERAFVPMDHATADAELPVAADALTALTRGETIESVRSAVLALPPVYREAVVLCDLHEMSYAQAAEALGCAVGTVRSRLHRGREMLVERLRLYGRAASTRTTKSGCAV
jgi:RNA polymerase sigma-70 factor (ECF subfamily)